MGETYVVHYKGKHNIVEGRCQHCDCKMVIYITQYGENIPYECHMCLQPNYADISINRWEITLKLKREVMGE